MVMVKPAWLLPRRRSAGALTPSTCRSPRTRCRGEYSMVEAAAANGWIDRRAAIEESLTAIRARGRVDCAYLLGRRGGTVGGRGGRVGPVMSDPMPQSASSLAARARRVLPGGVNSPGPRLPLGRRRPAVHRQRLRRLRHGCRRDATTSTSSARGGPRSSATRTRRSSTRCAGEPPAGWRSARRLRARSSSPRRSSAASTADRARSAWSQPAPRRR